ncbi:uncharacterized protein J3R85_006456 [Psidium guajava]|nr:uncharacterized protein J3R85_006456 [Psidium guajava]
MVDRSGETTIDVQSTRDTIGTSCPPTFEVLNELMDHREGELTVGQLGSIPWYASTVYLRQTRGSLAGGNVTGLH